MNQEKEKLLERIKSLLSEDLSDEQLESFVQPIFQSFVTLFPSAEPLLKNLQERVKAHKQYRLTLESILEVLETYTASQQCAATHTAAGEDIKSRVEALKKAFSSSLKR